MKLFLPLLVALSTLPGDGLPDFSVGDILVLQDHFIAIKIANPTPQAVNIPPQLKERVFLSLAINGIKRAEYRIKAMDPSLFAAHSFIIFKTNFRASQPMTIRVELNGDQIVPEKDFSNNVLEKSVLPLPE